MTELREAIATLEEIHDKSTRTLTLKEREVLSFALTILTELSEGRLVRPIGMECEN